jgi:hypothetical protein
MEHIMIFKLIVIALLISTLYALGSALFSLLRRGDGDSERMVKALTWRIGLSLGIFILLMIGYATGLITPHTTTMPPSGKAEVLQSDQR